MKRRKFLESSLVAGGVAATSTSLASGLANGSGCDDTGAMNDALSGLLKLGRIQPKSSDQIAGSYWGIQAGAYDEKTLSMARAIGVKWTRVLFGWGGVEREKGHFDWSRSDESVDALLRFGITPFVTLTNGNSIYTGVGRYDDPRLAAIYGDSPAPPLDDATRAAWLVFVEHAIERYKDRIQYWEVWNEPNHRKYWGAPPEGDNYGKLVKVTWDEAYDVIAERLTKVKKEHGPDSIAGFSCARATNEENFLMQKFMRTVIGTNNIDHCARL